MKYIDIGANLFCKEFKGKEEEIYQESKNRGIGMIITGSSLSSSEKASLFVKDREGVFSTAGIHPHDAGNCTEDTLKEIRKIIEENEKVAAVGECGLDYDRMFSPKEKQKECFERQVSLAEELKKPLFLHERGAEDDFYGIMKEHRDICKRSVVHCFTGTKETVMKYLDLGCYIGITGWICDERRNKDLSEALKVIPKERLMIETDCPYLLPRNCGLTGKNYPWYISYVLKETAKIKETDEELLRKQVLENTEKFFSL